MASIIRLSHPEKMAAKVIQSYAIKTAPVDLEEIVLLEGLTVVYMKDWTSLHGMLFRETQKIGINAKDHPNRQRFSLAHELGHFFLNHFQDRTDPDPGMDGVAEEAKDTRDQEANAFAAELLMPHGLLRADFKQIRNVDKVAALYKVSTEALWRRLMRLKII